MKDIVDNSFKSDGRKYTLISKLISKDKSFNTDYSIGLNNSDIEYIEFSNELNSLYLTGSLIYTDSFGIVDKFLNNQYSFFEIYFYEVKEEDEDSFFIDHYDEENKIEHSFFINNIEILNRNGNNISYKFSLISSHIFNLISNISYSNFAKDPEDIITIVKNCLTLAELKYNDETFSEITTNVKFNYITNGNDTIQSIIKFLFGRFFYLNKDESLKCIYYDFVSNSFKLYDIKNSKTINGVFPIILSLNDSDLETMSNGKELVNLASVTKFKAIDTIKNLMDSNLFTYDINSNNIKNEKIDSKTISNYINNNLYNIEEDNSIESKFNLNILPVLTYLNNFTDWNNTFDIYNKCIKSLTQFNSIVLNAPGYINRQPSSLMQINIDRDYSKMLALTRKEYEDIKNRNKIYEGDWIISKVRHIIKPKESSYKQNIILFRNFRLKNSEE